MSDVIITGAGRGIGRALAIALDKRFRQIVVARTAVAAGSVVREAAKRGKSAEAMVGDLSSLASARALGERLSTTVRQGTTLVHNAGVWPNERALTVDGYEYAFAVNALGAIAMQAPLLARGLLKRIIVVGTVGMFKGRFDADRTPNGDDFTRAGSYYASKLALAVAMQDLAVNEPKVAIAVVDPGITATELGARDGFVGWLERKMRRAQPVERAGELLAGVLAHDDWATPGTALWMPNGVTAPWPTVPEKARSEIQRTMAEAFAPSDGPPPLPDAQLRSGTTAWRSSNDSTLN